MTEWIMLACGCLMASMGALTLNGWRRAQYRHPRKAGWGFILIGAGFSLDGVPRLVGWSYAVGAALAGVAVIVVVLGGLLQLLGRTTPRADRLLTSLADTNKPEPHRTTANVSGAPAEEEQGPTFGDDDLRPT